MKISTKSIVVAAVTIALTFALAPLPIVFMLPLLFTATTRGMKMSLFMGLSFGVVSYIYALMMPSLIAIAFVEAPWIAILPRIAVGFTAHGAFVLSKKLIKGTKKAAVIAPYALSAAVGSLTNTVLVVSLLVLFKGNTSLEGMTIYIYAPTMLLFGLIELITYTVIVPLLALTVQRALRLNTAAPAKNAGQKPACDEEKKLN